MSVLKSKPEVPKAPSPALTGTVLRCIQHDLRETLYTVEVRWEDNLDRDGRRVQAETGWSSINFLKPGERVYQSGNRFVSKFRPRQGDRVWVRRKNGVEYVGEVGFVRTEGLNIVAVSVATEGGPGVVVPFDQIRPLKS